MVVKMTRPHRKSAVLKTMDLESSVVREEGVNFFVSLKLEVPFSWN